MNILFKLLIHDFVYISDLEEKDGYNGNTSVWWQCVVLVGDSIICLWLLWNFELL